MARKLLNGLDLATRKIINLATPSADSDAATKLYVDANSTRLVGRAKVTSDVALSTTNATYTTLISDTSVPVVGTHLYRISVCLGHSFATTGTGQAFDDAWEFRIMVDMGAGYVAPDEGAVKRVRNNATPGSAIRHPAPDLTAYWTPVGSGSFAVKAEAAKVIGASTVATTVQTLSGGSPFTLYVEDLGEV